MVVRGVQSSHEHSPTRGHSPMHAVVDYAATGFTRVQSDNTTAVAYIIRAAPGAMQPFERWT